MQFSNLFIIKYTSVCNCIGVLSVVIILVVIIICLSDYLTTMRMSTKHLFIVSIISTA